ncbi:signal peptidase I [Desulfobulbus propionicus DSM 2032]|uniref:Signal peptidase I n=1 Tax=Desulfobulbus propionicus (strain ATCC 33891 / DSM 2032 / VKM B-1956 / 1pr3) TaxID=577650 RepID=A0A7U3YLC1_DESPD|nr:hypothetical protein [Desulfobulbus propionicus]ADW17507.1 signal peptidase I [Desulfobulbus propionicus DSM 2032]
MDASLDNLNNEPDQDREKSEKEIKKKLKRMGNPVWGFLWRFFLCCALIDIPFWAYFHFVKGVPILVGLQQIRNEVQEKFYTPKEPEQKKIVKFDFPQPTRKPS